MIANLLKLIGIRLYVVRYRFPSRHVKGRMVEGCSGPMLKSTAEHIAAYGNIRWSGNHWIEKF
jgi:hypothetical protein